MTNLLILGIEARAGRGDDSNLADAAVRRDAYQAGRPSETDACRTGDARFFPEGA